MNKSASSPLRILHVEDCEDDSLLIERHLRNQGFRIDCKRVEDSETLTRTVQSEEFDVVLCDHILPKLDSLQALEIIRQHHPDNQIPFLIVSGHIGEHAAVAAMKAGAHDIIPKDDLSRLVPAIEREIRDFGIRIARRETEAQLRESNRKLKEALATISETQEHFLRMERFQSMGQMSSGIAHDFNNALTKMLGITELLQARHPEEEEVLGQMVTLIQDSANVVRRLRDFYRKRPQHPDAEPVFLPDVIGDAVEMTKPKWKAQSEAKGAPITVRTELAETNAVLAEPSDLREVLTNLVFNACDAMPEGGEILIRTEPSEDGVITRVIDTGCGMPEDVRRRCLEPLFTTKGKAGTGLGLGIVDSIVRRFGGQMGIQSEEGRGTTVSLVLPYADPSVTHDPDEPLGGEAEEPLSGLHVLVVDDEPLILKLVTQLLAAAGHEADAAVNARDALQRLEETGPFDVVISDRSMPGMGGDELACTIKHRYPELPVIMATGFGDLMSVEGDLPDGVDSILPKPVSREDLQFALEATVGKGTGRADSRLAA